MNKILLAFCFITNIAFAQKMPDYGINRVHIYLEDKTLLFETIPVTSQPDVSPDKTYYWYGANTVHQTQGGFSGKLLNGSYKEFYLDKNLKEEGRFKAGLKDGVWKSWATGGRLVSSITWHNGVKAGKYALYNDSSLVSQSGHYRNDLLNGPIKFYVNKDSVHIVKYKDGHINPDTRPFLKRINIFKKKNKEAATKP
ncbi:hypothetical protein [Mucilaginibacter sp.]|uniref:toxin-antitoxin system YwqK family antitoxin n=1 Tax=Mucilaginibacter sp. TaxID=1882438 RepID=UPI0032675DF3